MRRVFLILLAGTFCFTLMASEPAKIEVVTENYPPLNYLENDKIIGLSTDIVKQVLDEAKIPYALNLYPWTRAYSKAEVQDNVLIYTLTRTKEREKKFHWLVKLTTPTFYIYAKKDLELPRDLKKMAQGKLKAICVREDAACDLFAKFGFSPEKENLVVVSDVEGSSEIKMVLANRAQFFICDSLSFNYRLKQLGLSPLDFRQVLKVKEGEGFYLGASKKLNEKYLKVLRQTIAKLKNSGKSLTISESAN